MKTLNLLILAVSLFADPAFAQSVGPGTGIGSSGTAFDNSADVNAKNKTNAGMSGAKSTTDASVNTQAPADGMIEQDSNVWFAVVFREPAHPVRFAPNFKLDGHGGS